MSQTEKHTKNQYRYPGAKPFAIRQQNIFFGREEDIENLYQLISVEQLVLLHSKSGLGKSSLLNAGIIPKINKDGKYESISFRFSADTADKNDSPSQISCAVVGQDQPSHPFLEKLTDDKDSLWYQLKNKWLNSKRDKSYLLIFDQFEELFTYSEKAIDEFKLQLVRAMNSGIPQNIRSYVEQQFRKDPNFLSDEEMELLHAPMKIKVVLAIRSDRMSLVAQLADFIPNILTNCYELEALTQQQAEDAILNPAYLKSAAFITPPFDYSDETIEAILNFLTLEHKDKIESFQLAILCQAVERKVVSQQLKLVERHHLGDIESIYKNYYEDQLELIGNPEEQQAARVMIEDGLIFEEEERRLSVYEGQIYKVYNISPELLRRLVDSHLLRAEPSMKGGYIYELSHDTLVAPVLRSKQKRKTEEARIAKEKARLEKEAEMKLLRQEAAVERRRRNRALMLAVFSVIASLVAVSFYWKANEQTGIAKEALDLFEKIQVEKDSATYEALIQKGKTLMAHKDYAAASGVFEEAKKFNLNPTLADSLKRVSDDRKGKELQFKKFVVEGDSLFNIGKRKYIRALEKYKEADKLQYNSDLVKYKIRNIEGMKDDLFYLFKNSGDKFRDAGGFQYAKRSYEYAREIRPGDSELLNLIKEMKK